MKKIKDILGALLYVVIMFILGICIMPFAIATVVIIAAIGLIAAVTLPLWLPVYEAAAYGDEYE